jgi:hypothetical protein
MKKDKEAKSVSALAPVEGALTQELHWPYWSTLIDFDYLHLRKIAVAPTYKVVTEKNVISLFFKFWPQLRLIWQTVLLFSKVNYLTNVLSPQIFIIASELKN